MSGLAQVTASTTTSLHDPDSNSGACGRQSEHIMQNSKFLVDVEDMQVTEKRASEYKPEKMPRHSQSEHNLFWTEPKEQLFDPFPNNIRLHDIGNTIDAKGKLECALPSSHRPEAKKKKREDCLRGKKENENVVKASEDKDDSRLLEMFDAVMSSNLNDFPSKSSATATTVVVDLTQNDEVDEDIAERPAKRQKTSRPAGRPAFAPSQTSAKLEVQQQQESRNGEINKNASGSGSACSTTIGNRLHEFDKESNTTSSSSGVEQRLEDLLTDCSAEKSNSNSNNTEDHLSIEVRKHVDVENMGLTPVGKAWRFVEALLEWHKALPEKHSGTFAALGAAAQLVAVDDMVAMAERMFETQESFAQAGKPVHVDIGFHYTRSENMARIRTDGLLNHAERTARNILSNYNGSSCGDGIYTGTYPDVYSRYGNICLVVARLRGHAGPPVNRSFAYGVDSHTMQPHCVKEMVVLRTSNQCIPLIQLPSSTRRQNQRPITRWGYQPPGGGTCGFHHPKQNPLEPQQVQEQLQQDPYHQRELQDIIDRFFNFGKRTEIEIAPQPRGSRFVFSQNTMAQQQNLSASSAPTFFYLPSRLSSGTGSAGSTRAGTGIDPQLALPSSSNPLTAQGTNMNICVGRPKGTDFLAYQAGALSFGNCAIAAPVIPNPVYPRKPSPLSAVSKVTEKDGQFFIGNTKVEKYDVVMSCDVGMNCGRGGKINQHFADLIKTYQPQYKNDRTSRRRIVMSIFEHIKDHKGRFLDSQGKDVAEYDMRHVKRTIALVLRQLGCHQGDSNCRVDNCGAFASSVGGSNTDNQLVDSLQDSARASSSKPQSNLSVWEADPHTLSLSDFLLPDMVPPQGCDTDLWASRTAPSLSAQESKPAPVTAASDSSTTSLCQQMLVWGMPFFLLPQPMNSTL